MAKSLQFVGFEPTGDLIDETGQCIHRLFNESPCDAWLEGQVSKEKNLFSGVILVRSSVGTFKTAVTGAHPVSVVHRMSRNIHNQIKEWKRHRLI